MSSFVKSAELTSDGLFLLRGWCWLLYDVRLVMGNAAREEEGCTHLELMLWEGGGTGYCAPCSPVGFC